MKTDWRSITLAACLTFSFAASAAYAAESVVLATPPGGTDVNQALLPPPGLYGAMRGVYGSATHTNDFNGNPNPFLASVAQRVTVGGLAALYVYPWQVFDGSLASTVVLAPSTNCLRVNAAPASLNGCKAGMGDTYVDVLRWSKYLGPMGATPGKNPFIPYGLTIALGYATQFPTGPYNSANIVNQGTNLFVLTPNIALTYNTGPNRSLGDSTQISARFFFAFPLVNSATNYQSGNVLNIDWAATELFGPWQVGVQGFFQTQYTNDIAGNGTVPLYGNRYEAAGLGPVVQYTFPDGAILKAKWTGSLLNKNSLEENTFNVVFAIKLL